MGHLTVKRVPLSFQWPLNRTWKGYVNPHRPPPQCAHCGGTGLNAATRAIADAFYDSDGFGARWLYMYGTAPDGTPTDRPPWKIVGDCRRWCDAITQDEVEALVAAGRLVNFTETWTPGVGWTPKRWETKGFWCPVCHIAVPQLSTEHHSCLCPCIDTMDNGKETRMLLLEGDDPRLHVPWAEEVSAGPELGTIPSTSTSWCGPARSASASGVAAGSAAAWASGTSATGNRRQR